MARHAHPFARALLLVPVFAVVPVLAGTYSFSGLWQSDGFPTAPHLFAAGVIAGSFLAAVPDRIRHRRQPRSGPNLRACLIAFCGGLVMMLALSLTGTDAFALLGSAMQGGVGALAFVFTAWLFACAAARLTKGVRR